LNRRVGTAADQRALKQTSERDYLLAKPLVAEPEPRFRQVFAPRGVKEHKLNSRSLRRLGTIQSRHFGPTTTVAFEQSCKFSSGLGAWRVSHACHAPRYVIICQR
jgi:hypothetical protein